MKKLLKSLRTRLHDAMRVLFCGRYFLFSRLIKTSTDKLMLSSVALLAAKRYFHLMCAIGWADDTSVKARFDMLITVLDTDNSVVLVYKEHGRCLVSYDCKTQADFDELLNQEVL